MYSNAFSIEYIYISYLLIALNLLISGQKKKEREKGKREREKQKRKKMYLKIVR